MTATELTAPDGAAGAGEPCLPREEALGREDWQRKDHPLATNLVSEWNQLEPVALLGCAPRAVPTPHDGKPGVRGFGRLKRG